MDKVIVSISMSLDGFRRGAERPRWPGAGSRGEVLHQWIQDADMSELLAGSGMADARRLRGVERQPARRPACFVLTHYVPQKWAKSGSAPTFVTDGIESAVAQAHNAAGVKVVSVAGGADIVPQAVEAGLIDEIPIQLAPCRWAPASGLFEQQQTAPIQLVQSRVPNPGMHPPALRRARAPVAVRTGRSQPWPDKT